MPVFKEKQPKISVEQAEKPTVSPLIPVLLAIINNIKSIQAGQDVQINSLSLLPEGGVVATGNETVNIKVPEVKGKTSKLIEKKETKKVKTGIEPVDFGQVLTQSLGILSQINTLSQKQKKLDLERKEKIQEAKNKGIRNPQVERTPVKVDVDKLGESLGLEQKKHFVPQELEGGANAVSCGAVTVIPVEYQMPETQDETSMASMPDQRQINKSERKIEYSEGDEVGTFGRVVKVIKDENGKTMGYVTRRKGINGHPDRDNFVYYSRSSKNKSGLVQQRLFDPLLVQIDEEKLRARGVSEWVISKVKEFNDTYKRIVALATLGLQYRSIQQLVQANLSGDIDGAIRKQVEPVLKKLMKESKKALINFSNSAKRLGETITLVCQSQAEKGIVVLTPAELVFLIQAVVNFFVGLAENGSFLQVKNNQL